jgi:hypothetical protein
LLPAKWAEYAEDRYEEVAEEKAEYALAHSDCGIEQGWVGYGPMYSLFDDTQGSEMVRETKVGFSVGRNSTPSHRVNTDRGLALGSSVMTTFVGTTVVSTLRLDLSHAV